MPGSSPAISAPGHLEADEAPSVRTGRYIAVTAQIRLDLRVGDGDGIVSGDLFRIDGGAQPTWVASFRSDPTPANGISIVAQDRYGATATGAIRLTPVAFESLQVLLYFDGRLDGLPMRREMALIADFVGTALRSFGLEVEVEEGVLGPPQVTFENTAMSIERALSGAGIEVHSAGVANTLPQAPAEGWSEKDIEMLSRRYAQIDMSNPNFALQMLWLSRSNQDGLNGVMFDIGDDRERQSLAVFASRIRETYGNDGPGRDRKLIQTAVHEIGHALNLAHRFKREVGRPDSTSFMNYDWKYRGGNRAGEFWQRFSYRFDPDELCFLCHAPYTAIVMGGARFGSARYWYEGDGGMTVYVPDRPFPGIDLQLESPRDGFFRFAEPVILSLTLKNETGRPLQVPKSILDPKAGFVELLVSRVARGRAAEGPPESFHPVVTRCFEVGEGQSKTIAHGDFHRDNVSLNFGVTGFTFAEPGVYQVQALLVTGDGANGTERITPSRPIRITIGYPEGRSHYRLADELFQADVGRWFALGAPARLSDVTDRLVDLAQSCDEMPCEISAHIYRAAMFGANRSSLRFEGDVLVRSDGDPERSAHWADALREIGLDIFDPATREGTEDYLKKHFPTPSE